MEPYYKEDFKKWSNKAASDESFRLYSVRDSVCPAEAEPKIQSIITRHGNEETYQSQVALLEPLTYMQARGLRIDVAGLRKAAKDAEEEEGRLEEELCTKVGFALNPRSSTQLQDYFYKKKGLTPYKSRQTGSVSVDALALRRISRKGFEEASLILRARKLRKFRGTYYEMEFDSDGRMRSAFNPIGTKTGRLASSKNIFGRGGNEQNLPPEFLQFVIADEGMDLYVFDLEQAENRLVAYIAPEPNMIHAFEVKVDLHRLTAALIFGKPVAEISDEAGSCPIGGGVYSERFWGKKSNHSFNYDLGYRAFALMCEITDTEGKFVYDRYHASYPGVHQYHAWIRAALRESRTITNLFGRSRYFLGDVEEVARDAYAQIPQSTVADIINRRGIIPIYREPRFREVDLLSQVHDSLVFQLPCSLPVEQRAEILTNLRDELQKPLQFRGRTFTIPVGAKVGKSLAKKKMEDIQINDYSTVGGLAEHLSSVYGKLGASSVIPTLDGYLSDSGLDEEEMYSELGDAENIS
jgi:DNA polymerase-1